MAKQTIQIGSIFAGESPSEYFGPQGAEVFRASYSVDPDFPKDDSALKMSGMIRPTAMAKFSGTEVTGVPLWIVTNPKSTNIYVYANDGKVHTVASNLTMGTALNSGNALTTSTGNGAAYYDNYIYFATNTDISRYGPLNGSPSLSQVYWVTTLSKTALVNTTYPSVRGVALPNHVMHRHTDNKLYFADVVGNQGVLHYIRTSKSSVEGDTNDASTYNALDFPYGYYPTAIETYGTDLCIALIEGTDTTIKQKRAKIAFWNTVDSSYSKITDVEFPDPLITAVKNINGNLYVFSGNASGGYRVSVFAGGYSFQQIAYFEDGLPPLPGAVDAELSRLVWGGFITDPDTVAVVRSYGSKRSDMPTGIQTPFKATSAGANPHVTALKFVEHASNSKLRPIIGWSDDSAKGLDKLSTTYGTWLWQSKIFRIGKPFQVTKVTIPLMQAVTTNMTITPKIIVDDTSTSYTQTVVNSTNFAAGERSITLYPSTFGKNNFYLELKGTGTALLTVGLPITIEIEIEDN